MSEGVNLVAGAKTSVAEYRQSIGSFPTTNGEAGLTTISSSYVTSILVGASGVITITFSSASGLTAGNDAIQFVPTIANGGVNWSCNGVGTTVDDNYLPPICRA